MDDMKALETRIRGLLAQKPRVLVALDGMAASGKTTLAASLAQRYSRAAVVHMDDFTIPFEDRHPGYFEEKLSNADLARFDREVLTPLESGLCTRYRPYVCHPEPGFLPPVAIPAQTCLVIVEGAYCLHPDLFDRYDLRVLCTVSPDVQRERILRRNGSAQLARFLSQWIPMENRHIQAHSLKNRCDLTLCGD